MENTLEQKIVTAMVECPKGQNQKFDYDPEARRFRLSKSTLPDMFMAE